MPGFKDYMYPPWQPIIQGIFSFHYYTDGKRKKEREREKKRKERKEEKKKQKERPTPSTSPLRQYTSHSSIVLCIHFHSLRSSVRTYVMTSFTSVLTTFIHDKCCGGW